MQEVMIQRYLGNKAAISSDILNVIGKIAAPGDLVFDAFSGSLAVSASLRAAGYRVACNDINHFSWTYARAYFSSETLPLPKIPGLVADVDRSSSWEAAVHELVAPYNADFPELERRTDIFDHYCEDGERSAFVSQRGTTGRRRFFSAANANVIDRALSKLRHWTQRGALDEQTRCLLMASLLSAVEKVSNTQGTYHDFPRSTYDARSLRPIKLKAPLTDAFNGPVSEFIGKAEDSLAFAPTLPRHKVLYLDPPYNFRQYTSYYFMLNMISSYVEVPDLDTLFSNVQYVRGQNMEDDFNSTFCKRAAFIPSLEEIVRRADTEYVVLSYFDGRNHWGEFKSTAGETTGRKLIEEFFETDLFEAGSQSCLPVKRLNYQSYGGYEAKVVQEFLFVAKKRMPQDVKNHVRGEQWIGRRLA